MLLFLCAFRIFLFTVLILFMFCVVLLWFWLMSNKNVYIPVCVCVCVCVCVLMPVFSAVLANTRVHNTPHPDNESRPVLLRITKLSRETRCANFTAIQGLNHWGSGPPQNLDWPPTFHMIRSPPPLVRKSWSRHCHSTHPFLDSRTISGPTFTTWLRPCRHRAQICQIFLLKRLTWTVMLKWYCAKWRCNADSICCPCPISCNNNYQLHAFQNA